MSWSFSLASYIYSQTMLIAAAAAFFAWRRRHTPGGRPLAGLLAAAALWACAEALEWAAPSLQTKMLLSKISHIGIQSLPVFYLFFVLRFTGVQVDAVGWRALLLWLVPLLAVAAAFTNDSHQLFWRHVALAPSPLGLDTIYFHGPLFWAATAYLYLLIGAATVLLLRKLMTARAIFWRPIALLMAAAAIPWLANIVYLSGANPLPGFDWTPLAFAATGVLLSWAIFRSGLLDLRPIARAALFEQMGDALLVIDAADRVVDANPAAVAFFSQAHSLIGQPVDALLPAEHFHLYADRDDEAVVVLHRDGIVCQLDVRVTQLSDPEGVSGGRLIALRDTTERMRMEETVRRNEQRYRTLVDNAPFPSIVSRRSDGAILFASGRARELLALAPEACPASRLQEFFVASPEGEHFLTVVQTQLPVADYEVQMHTAAGASFWALISAVPVVYAGEEAILASLNDVTVRRQAEQALIEARHAAEATARAKNEFLATMSHELRTPLSSVIGLAEALQTEAYGPLNERQRRSLATIVQSGGRLTTLVNEVLDLSRLEAGAVQLDHATVPVDEVCRSAMLAVQPLRPHELPLLYTIDPANLTIPGDARRLRQVLICLLENAIKFTAPPQRIGLDVSASPTAGVARFVVWDEGIGIDEARQRQLFRPFEQLDAGLTRHYEGIGVGLAIVRHLVELHGGSVAVVSAPGQGSRFTVELPLDSGQ